MKKLLSCILSIAMALTAFSGCSGGSSASTSSAASAAANTISAATSGTAKAPKDTLVCLSISNTANDFMSGLVSGMQKKFTGAGYKFQSVSADASAQKQIQQIENFVSMKADIIIVLAVEPTSLTDVCKRAMAQGTKIYAFTTDTGAYTAFRGSNETKVGESIAEVASKWVDKAFANAKDGSVNTVLFKYTGSSEGKLRSDGLGKIASLNKKVKITKTVELENTTAAAMKSAENLFQTNPETNVVLCYNGAMAAGVNSYAMSPNSAVKDKSKFGVFGSDLTDEFAADIKSSMQNKAVLRGTAMVGADMTSTINAIFEQTEKILKGNFEKITYVPVSKIDTDNISQFSK